MAFFYCVIAWKWKNNRVIAWKGHDCVMRKMSFWCAWWREKHFLICVIAWNRKKYVRDGVKVEKCDQFIWLHESGEIRAWWRENGEIFAWLRDWTPPVGASLTSFIFQTWERANRTWSFHPSYLRDHSISIGKRKLISGAPDPLAEATRGRGKQTGQKENLLVLDDGVTEEQKSGDFWSWKKSVVGRSSVFVKRKCGQTERFHISKVCVQFP